MMNLLGAITIALLTLQNTVANGGHENEVYTGCGFEPVPGQPQALKFCNAYGHCIKTHCGPDRTFSKIHCGCVQALQMQLQGQSTVASNIPADTSNNETDVMSAPPPGAVVEAVIGATVNGLLHTPSASNPEALPSLRNSTETQSRTIISSGGIPDNGHAIEGSSKTDNPELLATAATSSLDLNSTSSPSGPSYSLAGTQSGSSLPKSKSSNNKTTTFSGIQTTKITFPFMLTAMRLSQNNTENNSPEANIKTAENISNITKSNIRTNEVMKGLSNITALPEYPSTTEQNLNSNTTIWAQTFESTSNGSNITDVYESLTDKETTLKMQESVRTTTLAVPPDSTQQLLTNVNTTPSTLATQVPTIDSIPPISQNQHTFVTSSVKLESFPKSITTLSTTIHPVVPSQAEGTRGASITPQAPVLTEGKTTTANTGTSVQVEGVTINFEGPVQGKGTTISLEAPVQAESTTINPEVPVQAKDTTINQGAPVQTEGRMTDINRRVSVQAKNTTVNLKAPVQTEGRTTTINPGAPAQAESITMSIEVPVQAKDTTINPGAPVETEGKTTTSNPSAPAQAEITTTRFEVPVQAKNTTINPGVPVQTEGITTDINLRAPSQTEGGTTNTPQSETTNIINTEKELACGSEVNISGISGDNTLTGDGEFGFVYIGTSGVTSNNGSIHFDGHSFLWIPFYEGNRFTSGITILMTLKEDPTFQQPQGLVSNCGGDVTPSFSITLYPQTGRVKFKAVVTSTKTPYPIQEIMEVYVPYIPGTVKTIEMQCNGQKLVGRVDTHVAGTHIPSSENYELSPRPKPLFVGTGCREEEAENFHGDVSSFAVYRCVRAEI